MNEIIVLKTDNPDKNIVYDYINDKLFLVETCENIKYSWSLHKKAKGQAALISLLCLPLFWLIKDINYSIILLYLLAFYLKKYVKQLFIYPFNDKIKSKHWESISYEKASQITENFNIVTFICFILGGMALSTVTYCCYDDLEVKFVSLVAVLLIGATLFAIWKDAIIQYKLEKKLKKLKNNL